MARLAKCTRYASFIISGTGVMLYTKPYISVPLGTRENVVGGRANISH